ncbi:phospholipase D-like domain-containing protein [Caenispirillum bisanense]|uniref:phospholipase D-like domain-containing protein n=1 Tax=Caenispirillum bisanense TaxID=414052 RepID=UPI0031DC6982
MTPRSLHAPAAPHPDPDPPPPLLAPEETCWRVAQADRFGMIVDCEDYFAAFREACLAARRRIFLVGWDFDTRVRLLTRNPRDGWSVKVGRFLTELVDRRPDLHLYILKWDVAFFTFFRQNPWPIRAIQWKLAKRVHFKLDGEHPFGSCHHQKVVCIDDRFAMVGAIDITRGRWDTRAHRDNDRRRITPGGSRYNPHHDVSSAVDGEAAQALGELCRDRWRRATGEVLEPVPQDETPADVFPWPQAAPVHARTLPVAIARTLPPWQDQAGIFEIEAMTLRAIARARRLIYLENQYFASRVVVEALAERLREADPPEVVVINPLNASGWLEQTTMDTARVLAVTACRAADHAGRFRIYCPVTQKGRPIYVHSKVTIIDEDLLRVGSANVNNRSMGFDSECDLAVAPGAEEHESRAMIRGRLLDLLAEHLDVGEDDLTAAWQRCGRLIPAIEALRRDQGRTLRPLEVAAPEELDGIDSFVIHTQIADPERPEKPWRYLKSRARGLFTLRW